MYRFNNENILSFFLAFVVIWFGYNEVTNPEQWVAYVPSFLGGGSMTEYLVVAHGIILILSGLSLIFNFHKRTAAFVILLMLAGIVFTLLSVSGLDEIAVRDIGLLGMALALTLKN